MKAALLRGLGSKICLLGCWLVLILVAIPARSAEPPLPPDESDRDWAITTMAYHGLTMGLLYGAFASESMGLVDSDHIQATVATTAIATTVGGIYWAVSTDMTPGDARMASHAMDLGALWATSWTMVGLGERDGERADARLFAAPIVGAIAGFVANEIRRDYRATTWGDAEAVRGAALWGGLAGITFANALVGENGSSDSRRTAFGFATALSMAGAVLGDHLVKDMHLSVGQGVVLDLALVSGSLIGAMAGLVGSDGNEQQGLVAATLGGAMGYGLSMVFFHSEPASLRHHLPDKMFTERGWLPNVTPISLQGERGQLLPGVGLGGSF